MSPLTVEITISCDEISFIDEETSFSSEVTRASSDSSKEHESELEEEKKIIMQIQQRIQAIYPTQAMLDAAKKHPTPEEKAEADSRSIYIGQVDYSVKEQELLEHFKTCGDINRVSIQRDKFSGRPKGFAYVEFGAKEAVELALALNESLLKGRKLKVSAKRTNLPFHAIQNLPGQPGKILPATCTRLFLSDRGTCPLTGDALHRTEPRGHSSHPSGF